MKLTFLIISAISIAILAVVFALQNPTTIGVRFLVWRFEGSLALVLLVTFACGFIVSALITLYTAIQRKWIGTDSTET